MGTALDELPGRAIPSWLADVVQAFELDARRLVTVENVLAARPELSPSTARHALAQLVRRGWLAPTGIRGTYEFIPGAAAGPYPSGDPWLVLRAELEHHPTAFHPGATAAAWLRGYAQRSPHRQLVVAAADTRIPRGLAAVYRVLRTSPAPAHDQIDGLPVPTAPELFAGLTLRHVRTLIRRGKLRSRGGIGLASVRQFMQQHDGRVEIESQEDVGTTVTVRMPLVDPHGQTSRN